MNTVDDDLHVRMRGMGVEMLSEAVCYYLVISGEQCTVCCEWEISQGCDIAFN